MIMLFHVDEQKRVYSSHDKYAGWNKRTVSQERLEQNYCMEGDDIIIQPVYLRDHGKDKLVGKEC